MMVGTVANKAHGIATILTRNTSRGRKPQLKTIPTVKAEDELSPMSQLDAQPEPEAEVPEVEVVSEKQEKGEEQENEKENDKQGKIDEEMQEQEKELSPLFPWEIRTGDGETRENIAVKEKILELAIYRRTFVEPADGEEEYVFDYAMFKDVARELLLSNPNLREKRETLVESVPVPVVSEELFWRNYFLRCNAVRIGEGLPSYLPEMEATPTPTGPLARLRRGLFGNKKRPSSASSNKSRRGFLAGGRSSSSDSSKTMPSEDDLSNLELDVDGEIEKELVKRRPSRAMELHLRPVPPSQASSPGTKAEAEVEDTSPGVTAKGETKKKEPEDTPDASSPIKSNNDREEYAPILV
ncbi:unnamed protein product [Phytophthora fragariaefolia]|uniref:Unnamed protein product n=1 Tax=Phytophthora fragariaefolia TaxID=1490495 RepID=A0A9W6XZG9_9STRA|nr:unnamed protein product [Phytophthora fragariaefolia]